MRIRGRADNSLGDTEQVDRVVRANGDVLQPVDAQQDAQIVENLSRHGRSMLWCSVLLDEYDRGPLRRRP